MSEERWFTCTPVEFGGAEDFFSRDSGLMSRGFKAIGVESMAVMPGMRKPEDLDELIRTDFANLESSDWWRSHRLDGVVLYAWGRPKFRKIAAAIHEAGIFLVLNQDNGGLVSPLAGFAPWMREQWNLSGKKFSVRALIRFAKLTSRGLSLGLFYTDPLRAIHLKQGDKIGCVSPVAADCYRRLCKIYGGKKLAEKVTVIPHAVEPIFNYDGRSKKRQILTVGRWDDTVQKRPGLLMQVAERLLYTDPKIRVIIAGNPTSELEQWHSTLPPDQAERLNLRGFTNRQDLVELMAESTVFYSPSAYESFGIAAAEALCSGCSVVAGQSVSMAAFDWFVGENSGTLASPDTVENHISALQSELSAWDAGTRDAAAISNIWRQRLHAAQIAAQVLALSGKSAPN